MFKKILHSKWLSLTFLVSFFLTAGGGLWAYLVLHNLGGSPLILHFDDIEGITSVGSPATIYFIAILGTAVVIMNFFIALELDQRDRFLGKVGAAVTLVFAVLLFLAFAGIINVN